MLSQHATLIIKWYTCHQADHCNACSNFSYSTGLVYSRWWVCYTDHNLFTLINMILCFGWHISVFSSVKHPISLVWMYITAIQEKTFCFLSINDLQQSISNFQFFPVPAMSNRCFRCCGMDEGCFNAPYRNVIIECLSHVTTFRNTVFLKENMISTGPVQENILKILHPKLKILLLFTHPQVFVNLYEFLSSAEHKGRCFEERFEPNSCLAPLTS